MSGLIRRRGRDARKTRGQALVEFSLVLIPFLFLLMGAVDLGRGIYVNNAVAQAAREIARATVVHPCVGSPCTTYSAQTQAVIATQKGLVPGMTDGSVVVVCTDVANNVLSATATGACPPSVAGGAFYRVTVTVPFSVLTPFIPVPKDFTLGAISHVQIP
jgi:Flp pilus assembly protein TadG